jgi:hypothetical protein
LTVSEQKADQAGVESGSLDAGPAVFNPSDAPREPVSASAQKSLQLAFSIDAPALVPGQGAAGGVSEADSPKADITKADAPKADAPKADVKADAPKVEAPKAEASHSPGKIMIMSSGERAWERSDSGREAQPESSQGMFGKRRIAVLAAVVLLSAMAGALGGGLATVGFTHVAGGDATGSGNHALEASVARIDADIQALKTGLEHTTKIGMSQFNKTSERLDKVEKAQAEPAAKLARLGEAVDKLRAAPVAAVAPVAAAPVAAKEITGSIAPAATTPAAAPKVEVARLPTVEGWLLRDVGRGGALIESRRRGLYEVYAGDEIPGLGRIDAVRKQDGHWVVVTSKGLIVAR